jgi:hypothetical protein
MWAGPVAAHADGHADHPIRTTLTERFCAHVFAEPESDGGLAQTVRREDLTDAAVIHVSLSSNAALHEPFVVSCAFADRNGNGSRDGSERIDVRVLRKTADTVRRIDYRQRLVTDPSTSVCVLSIVLDGSMTHRFLVSATTCILNPAADVPESPMVALLGLGGLGMVVVVGSRRRRAVAV